MDADPPKRGKDQSQQDDKPEPEPEQAHQDGSLLNIHDNETTAEEIVQAEEIKQEDIQGGSALLAEATKDISTKEAQDPFELAKDGPKESEPFGMAKELTKQADTESPVAADNSTSNSPRKSTKETTNVKYSTRNRRGKNK